MLITSFFIESRNVELGIGPQAGPEKTWRGAGLGRAIIGPFFCGTGGQGLVRDWPYAGWPAVDLREWRNPQNLTLQSPFLAST